MKFIYIYIYIYIYYTFKGIYPLTCQDCNRQYIGQTGRPIFIRYQEHFLDYKRGNGQSKFAHPLLDNKHSVGFMEDIMVE